MGFLEGWLLGRSVRHAREAAQAAEIAALPDEERRRLFEAAKLEAQRRAERRRYGWRIALAVIGALMVLGLYPPPTAAVP
jgi:ferric-dicitrate binding protein FerR (iron transport regulator)